MTSEWGATKKHIPVLQEDVLSYLAVKPDGIYLDGTLGLGGHASAVQKQLSPKGQLVGFDGDEEAVRHCEKLLSPSCHLVQAPYDTFPQHLSSLSIQAVDGMLLDLGMSSYQLDTPARGFAYRTEGPLDMRFDENGTTTARHIVNSWPVSELKKLFKETGEERRAFAIATAIAKVRDSNPVDTTSDLTHIIKSVVGDHAATKTLSRIFQGLRMVVNSELMCLEKFLNTFAGYLKTGGRIVIISYHSLEDRMVKQTFRKLEKGCVCPPAFPECRCGISPTLKVLTPRVVRPTEEETVANNRARSGRLRAAEKI